MKKYCYLFQAREKIPLFDKLRTEESDCFVLYFRNNIENDNEFYFPNSSWSQGRNKLLEFAVSKNIDYEYYIFADDDINLQLKNGNGDSFSKLHELLDVYKPAVSFADYWWHLKCNDYPHTRKNEGIRVPICYDACMNVFHKNAIKVLLPYEDKFDKISWWWSQELLNHVSWDFYDNKLVQFNELLLVNGKSDPYPRDSDLRQLNTIFIEHYLPSIKQTIKKHPLYPENRSFELSPNSYAYDIPIDKYKLEFLTNYDLSQEYWTKKIEFWNKLGYKLK
jgi:hypothetical protein